jgi:hypothetical protein
VTAVAAPGQSHCDFVPGVSEQSGKDSADASRHPGDESSVRAPFGTGRLSPTRGLEQRRCAYRNPPVDGHLRFQMPVSKFH